MAANKRKLRELRKLLDDALNEPDEPTGYKPLIVYFKHTFPGGDTAYSYAAIKQGKYWYLTGQGNRLRTPMSWEQLIDFADDPQKIAVVTQFEKVGKSE